MPTQQNNRLTQLDKLDSTPEIFVFCLKKRFSGVSQTIASLLPVLANYKRLAYVGPTLSQTNNQKQPPENYTRLSLLDAICTSRRRLKDGRRRLWHLRRNKEMLIAVFLRDILRLPILLVFTSAAIRKHSPLPRWLISRMDFVIATTEAAAKFISTPCHVVGHGVNTSHFALQKTCNEDSDTPETLPTVERSLSEKSKAWQDSGLPGEYGIGIFGRVREEKGVHLFVDALITLLPHFPNFCGFIAGLCQTKDRSYSDALKQKIAKAGLSRRIVFIGEVKSNDMPLWYQRSLITVACPLYEGYGLTAIESMACGSAVIASRTGAFERMVCDEHTGKLVKLNCAESLKAALEPLMQNPRLAAQMGLAGRLRVEAQFSIEHEANGILQCYQQAWLASFNVESVIDNTENP